MAAITEALLRFVDTHPPTAKLYKLFSTFLHLCSPLTQKQDHRYSPQSLFNNSSPTMPSGTVNTTQPCQVGTQGRIHPLQHDMSTVPNFDQIKVGGSDGQDLSKLALDSAWNEDMFRDLFNSQPWLGWTESNI